MNADEALRAFANAEAEPWDAMRWALDHWDEAAPRFIARLRAGAAASRHSDADLDALFYLIHLCGEKGETRAYAPLCQLIARSGALEDMLGDAVTETLPGILINVCDGDPEPLQHAIESADANSFARASALEALGYLSRAKGLLSDEEMLAYLRRLAEEMPPRSRSEVWTGFALVAGSLGYDKLAPEVARLFSKSWIDREALLIEDFHADIALSRRDPDGLAAFRERGVGPLQGVIETLQSWRSEGAGDSEGNGESDGLPHVNPLRDVGRNDPCPCGSGKKYKKCCLAA